MRTAVFSICIYFRRTLPTISFWSDDPGRVETIASHFQQIELKKSNREFYTITGSYRGHRLSVISTGIGPDNIDIVINELDALAHIDLKTKEIKAIGRTLNIVRIGTSGSVQADIPVDSFVISEKSIGCDGVLRFYANNESVCDIRSKKLLSGIADGPPLQPALM